MPNHTFNFITFNNNEETPKYMFVGTYCCFTTKKNAHVLLCLLLAKCFLFPLVHIISKKSSESPIDYL